MQAVGNEVIIALLFPVLAIGGTLIYYWRSIHDFIHSQFSAEVRIEQTEEQRQRRQAHLNDLVCSICLQQPKRLQISSTCGHTFCAECVFSLYQHQATMIKCPLCRQDMHVLFRLFDHTAETEQIEQKMREYNRRFDDNRTIVRTILQLPYVLQRLGRYMLSGQFAMFFLRSIHIIRMLMVIIVYLLMPFDLIPESVLGVVGYLDDILLALFFIVLFVTIAGLQFMRRQ